MERRLCSLLKLLHGVHAAACCHGGPGLRFVAVFLFFFSRLFVLSSVVHFLASLLDWLDQPLELEGQIGEEEGWPLGFLAVRSVIEAEMTLRLSCSR
jgi:hypothetical protein